ncbi:FadR/GntR family transcriptional regulator [Clostridium fallax]|uniref:Transcriptional regulator, GntR family n=1 Tax=Clostridium fallax TaxID=1533 RepID=A0A1M4U866_9CLOT|nr:FadR/GntR family transcriptional regulator [Clostridium fallax]SHE52753.1 transcriptional regulator, GntR family [Clostridium fallax]SQB06120.1 transcriptional regulator [Clostridium fallax]
MVKKEKANNKVYKGVVEEIKNKIVSGELKKGQKLPPKRELAEKLSVSRASVREAMRALEVIGFIESKQGAGNYIKESFEDVLIEPLSMMFMLQQINAEEISELRRGLELEAAVLAAERADEEDILKLEHLIKEMSVTENEDRNVILDKEFHYTIAKASKNKMFLNILNVISELIDNFIKGIRKEILSKEENKERLLKVHSEIALAIRERNKMNVYKAMEKHCTIINENILLRTKKE